MQKGSSYSEKTFGLSLWELIFGKAPKGPELEQDYKVVTEPDPLRPGKQRRRVVSLRKDKKMSPKAAKKQKKAELGRLEGELSFAYCSAFARDGYRMIDTPTLDLQERQARLKAFDKATSYVDNNAGPELKMFMEVSRQELAKASALEMAGLSPGGPTARGDNAGANPSHLHRDTFDNQGNTVAYEYGANSPHPTLMPNRKLSQREEEALFYKKMRHDEWREEMFLGPMAPHYVPIKKD